MKEKFRNLNSGLIPLAIFVSLLVYPAYGQQPAFTEDSRNLGQIDSSLFMAYSKVRLAEAWDKINGSGAPLSEIHIGIIDSGIDATDGRHPEFQNVILNAISPELFRDSEERGHGTKVSGIIGANNISFPNPGDYYFPQMNGILSGIHNLNYALELGKMPISILPIFSMASTIDALTKKGAKVMNMSFSSNIPTSLISRWIFSRIFEKNPDILFVVIAGNFEFDFLGLDVQGVNAELVTPANWGDNFDNVITVGATDLDNNRASFSNFGDAVNISAPGIDVFTPAPRGKGNFPFAGENQNNYDRFFSGTSASAPMVTGVAGLIKAIKPDLIPAQIKQILVETADPVQTGEPDKRIGTGCYLNPDDQINTGCRLNAYKAVCHPLVLNCIPPPPPTPSILTITDITSSSVTLTWTKNTDTDFSYYDLYRITSFEPLNVILLKRIYNRDETIFTDTLPYGTAYYYTLRTYNQINQFSRSNSLGALYLPHGNINIDGLVSDWSGFTPSIQDYINDKQPGSPLGTDISNVYLAHDEEYFYARMDLADGSPNTQNVVYYSISFDSRQEGHIIGDRYLRSQFFPGPEQNQSILRERTSIDPHQAITIAVEPAASGPNTLEMRTPLSKLNGGLLYFFVRASADLSALAYYDGTIQIALKLPGI